MHGPWLLGEKAIQFLKTFPVHPICFAAFSVLSLYVANYNQVYFSEVVRSLLLSVTVAALLFFALGLTGLGWQKAGLATSILTVLFFSYRYPIDFLAKEMPDVFQKIGPVLIIVPWPAIAIVSIWAVARWLKNSEPLHLFMNVTGLALVAMSTGQILVWQRTTMNASGFSRIPVGEIGLIEGTPVAPARSPDIYYIILDGYGREDSIGDVIGYDNSAFLARLEEHGFYVASASTSNYSNTAPSLASALNFAYLQDLDLGTQPASNDYRPLRELISRSQLGVFLQQRGYRVIHFETGFQLTDFREVEGYIQLEGGPNYFESLMLSNAFSFLWLNSYFSDRYQNRIRDAFSRLSDLSDVPSPKFVFVHIIAVHPPFVFGPEGEVVRRAGYTQMDTNEESERLLEIEGYRNQLQYINTRVLETVGHILQYSTSDPVIILQGDHGSGIYMDWQSSENTCFKERMAILNAYYLPGGKTELLYDSITPVNSFRVVMNAYFGQNLPLIEDRNYFSLWESPYLLQDVTGVTGKCPYLK